MFGYPSRCGFGRKPLLMIGGEVDTPPLRRPRIQEYARWRRHADVARSHTRSSRVLSSPRSCSRRSPRVPRKRLLRLRRRAPICRHCAISTMCARHLMRHPNQPGRRRRHLPRPQLPALHRARHRARHRPLHPHPHRQSRSPRRPRRRHQCLRLRRRSVRAPVSRRSLPRPHHQRRPRHPPMLGTIRHRQWVRRHPPRLHHLRR